MTRRRIAVLVVAFTLTAAACASAAFPSAKTHAIVIGRSIGGVAIGQSLTAAQAAWGPGAVCSGTSAKSSCSYTGPATSANVHPEWAAFGLVNGKVTAMFIYPAFDKTTGYVFAGSVTTFRTSKGIHVGSSAKAVRRAYPKAKSVAKGAQYVIKKGHIETEFAVINKVVYSIGIITVAK